MDNPIINYFAIIHKDNPGEALMHLSIPGESKEVAADFAAEDLQTFKNGLELVSEEFE